jgi:hypothetical protein
VRYERSHTIAVESCDAERRYRLFLDQLTVSPLSQLLEVVRTGH